MIEERKKVWDTLSKIDVGEFTEEKNGMTYLSWAHAWAKLKDSYPLAYFEKHLFGGKPYMVDAMGNAFVQVTVTIPFDDGSVFQTEVFPVLNHANKTVKEPDAFQVNTSLQRCLTKAISYLGLGAYIYAGEDLPPGGVRAVAPVEVVAGTDEVERRSGTTADIVKAAFFELMTLCETVEHIDMFWLRNKEALAFLSEASPEQYSEVVAAFSTKKRELIAAKKV